MFTAGTILQCTLYRVSSELRTFIVIIYFPHFFVIIFVPYFKSNETAYWINFTLENGHTDMFITFKGQVGNFIFQRLI